MFEKITPTRDGTTSLVLSQSELHIKEWNPADQQHTRVGNKESTCTKQLKLELEFYSSGWTFIAS